MSVDHRTSAATLLRQMTSTAATTTPVKLRLKWVDIFGNSHHGSRQNTALSWKNSAPYQLSENSSLRHWRYNRKNRISQNAFAPVYEIANSSAESAGSTWGELEAHSCLCRKTVVNFCGESRKVGGVDAGNKFGLRVDLGTGFSFLFLMHHKCLLQPGPT